MQQTVTPILCSGCGDPIQVDFSQPTTDLGGTINCFCRGTTFNTSPELLECARLLATAAALPEGERVVSRTAGALAAELWQELLDFYDRCADACVGDGFDTVRHAIAPGGLPHGRREVSR